MRRILFRGILAFVLASTALLNASPPRAVSPQGTAIDASPVFSRAVTAGTQRSTNTLSEKGLVSGPDRERKMSAPDETSTGTTTLLPVPKDELSPGKHRASDLTPGDISDLNRRSEHLLYAAEMAATLAWLPQVPEPFLYSGGTGRQPPHELSAVSGPPAQFPGTPVRSLHPTLMSDLPEETTYPARLLARARQNTRLLQMHDIPPGSSIPRPYEDADRIAGDLQTSVGRTLLRDLSIVAQREGRQWYVSNLAPVRYVFNLLPWERTGIVLVEPPNGAPVVLDGRTGEVLPQQLSAEDPGQVYVQLTVPAGGYRVIRFEEGEQMAPLSVPGDTLENASLRARIDRKTGNLAGLLQKQSGREMLGQPTTSSRALEMEVRKAERFENSDRTPEEPGLQGNVLQVHVDSPSGRDARDVGLTGPMDELSTTTEVSDVTTGPVFAEITVRKRYGSSFFRQTYRLYHALPWIDVLNDIQWNERHAMLMAAFPLSVRNTQAVCGIPFAAVERPTVRSGPREAGKYEHSGIQWGNMDDVSGEAGLALLTMNNHGFDAMDNVLRLSLLRPPDVNPNIFDQGEVPVDKGRHRFSYGIFPHPGTWQEADVVRRGYEYNHCLLPIGGVGPTRPEVAVRSLVAVEPSNVMLSALKKSEEDDSVIVRVYEAEGTETPEVTLSLPWYPARVESCDLPDRSDSSTAGEQRPARMEGRNIRFPLGKHEVATYRIHLR